MSEEVSIVALAAEREADARSLGERWGINATGARFQLQLSEEHLQLVDLEDASVGAVYVDFVGGAVGHRRRFGGGRGQPIARAVGLKGGATPSVVDATGGLGRDAFVLASLGCDVTLIERSAVVAALLEDGLLRAGRDEVIGPWVRERMHLVHSDAVSWMEALPEERFPDVVYLDPMFPHRRKSAQVKKEMRLLQLLLGGDEDADSLLPAALRIARKRVVVKRPDYAPDLAEMAPSMRIESKKNRFDVYVKAAMQA